MQAIAKPAWPVFQRGHSLAQGIIAAYPFFEGAGGVYQDLGGSNPSSGVGAPIWVGSSYGSALSFNGSSQGASIPHLSLLSGAPRTYSFMMYPAALVVSGVFTTLLAQGYDGSSEPVFFDCRQNANNTFGAGTTLFFGGFGSGFSGVTSNLDLGVSANLNQWYVVHGVVTNSLISIYVNGVLKNSTSVFLVSDNNKEWNIGYLDVNGSNGRWFTGAIQNVRVWNRALSAFEIQQDFLDPFAIYRTRSRWWEVVLGGGGTTVTTDALMAMEFLAAQRGDRLVQVESLKAVQISPSLPAELLSLQRGDGASPVEAIATERSDATVGSESLATARADAAVLAEALGATKADAGIPVEAAATARADGKGSVEFLATARSDGNLPVEWSGLVSITADGFVPLEWSAKLFRDGGMPAENVVQVIADRLAPAEILLGVVRDGSLQAEGIGTALRDGGAQIEFSSLVIVDHRAAIELLATARVDGTIPVESLGKVLADARAPTEIVSQVIATDMVIADGMILLEWTRALNLDPELEIVAVTVGKTRIIAGSPGMTIIATNKGPRQG